VSPAATLEVAGLSAGYGAAAGSGGALPVLAGVGFHVPAGHCLAVVGASGCGKSTLLHVLAGLLAPLAGSVTVGGQVVAAADWAWSRGGPGCSAGHAAYMFQDDLLLPWKTAAQNAAMPTRLGRGDRRVSGTDGRRARRERARGLEGRARTLLTEFGLGDALDVPPGRLSGGMRQRVALARTMLMDRGLILLDEPLGSLDAVTRAETRLWLLEVMAAHPATWVLVTHDVEEAVLLGDSVAVLHGRPARLVHSGAATLGLQDRMRLAASAAGEGLTDEPAALALAAAVADVRAALVHDARRGRPVAAAHTNQYREVTS
jgi:NitT/TauT family transport system ATP-binding protein